MTGFERFTLSSGLIGLNAWLTESNRFDLTTTFSHNDV
jgi:hypothetical protein